MSWVLRDEEIRSVLALVGANRYRYWVKKVADQQQTWSLCRDGGWALAGDDSGRELIPVWPHEAFASLCAIGMWAGYQPKAIAVDAWLDRWIPGMVNDGRLVAVFPTTQEKGVAVEPRNVESDLREELLQYD